MITIMTKNLNLGIPPINCQQLGGGGGGVGCGLIGLARSNNFYLVLKISFTNILDYKKLSITNIPTYGDDSVSTFL